METKIIKRGKKDRQKICDDCGAYYKHGCSYYVYSRIKDCAKQK